VKELEPRFKLWLNCGDAEGAFGDGKWRLLEAVETEGSLRAASDVLGISYRKAWGDLRKAERVLGVRLVDKRRGGRAGGQTALTAEGKQWLAAYLRFRSEIQEVVKRAYTKHIRGLVK
jgi:molybdate transport system regulatory protein